MNTATLTREEARVDLYPSRGGLKSNIVPRNHPTVWSSADVEPPIDRSLVEQYQRDGFLVLPNLFSPEEVANLQAELERLRHQAESLERPEVITEKGTRKVRSIFKVHELSAVFAKLAADERLAGLASYLLGDQVYLHQSRMNYKPGFHGKEFYWHSDFETWHIEDGMPLPRALSISVSLTDNTPHNGPLLVMPGSHKHYVVCEGETPPDNYQMSLQAQEIGVPSDENLARLAAEGGLVDTAGPAGSVLIFDCNLMHGSNSNITHLPRSNAFFVYNALSNAVEEPFCSQPPRPEFIATREQFTPLNIRKNGPDDFHS